MENNQLPLGKENIITVGVKGERTIVEEITYTDEVISGRKVISQSITKEPITQIIERGTQTTELKTETRTDKIPFKTIEKTNKELPLGNKNVLVAGKEGTRTNVYAVTYVNGKEVQREVTSSIVTSASIDRVIEIGTRVIEKKEESTKETLVNKPASKPAGQTVIFDSVPEATPNIREVPDVVDNDYGSQLTDDKWALPEDWDIASPRRGNIPEVVWQMMSVGDGINYMIELVNQKEGIISGFINPTYTIEVTLGDPLTDKVISILEVEVDENGYFSIDAEVISDAVPMIKIFDENSNLVFKEALKIYHYEPTELTHESGLLTLNRYFIDQPYMEGFSYPHAKVTIVSLTSDGFVTLESVIADEYGYFYSETPAHETNLTTNIVSVEHPDTKETVTVAPYPWTQEELEKVNQ